MKTKTASKMHCSEVTKYICENLDEQLNSPKCRAIKKHLQTCPKCLEKLAGLKKVISLYRKESVPRISPAIEKRLFATLNLKLYVRK